MWLLAAQVLSRALACADSLGNHAQGVAYSAKKLGIPATIVMPRSTPAIKHEAVARMGAKVVLVGQDFDDAKREAARLCQQHGLTNIPPYDDPFVIAGQGTVAMEIVRQMDVSRLAAVFCCAGGGGLISGIGAYIKRVAPHVKIIACEAYDADAYYRSWKSGERVLLKEVGLFADGAAVRQIGAEPFRLCREITDDCVRASTDEICAAIKDVFEETRSIIEPAGALGLAGMKKYLAEKGSSFPPSATFCAVLSGANMNFDRLRFVSERADLGLAKEVLFHVVIPDRPGTFLQLQRQISPRDVTEFSFRTAKPGDADGDVPASIFMSFNVQDREKEVAEVLHGINEFPGFFAQDISDNELAKTHIRYMTGGSTYVPGERLFSFEFPERPNSLTTFLEALPNDWNLTLFHYRNQGGDIARVLVGLQVREEDDAKVAAMLERLKYPVREETSNPIYSQFLCKKRDEGH